MLSILPEYPYRLYSVPSLVRVQVQLYGNLNCKLFLPLHLQVSLKVKVMIPVPETRSPLTKKGPSQTIAFFSDHTHAF